jgi:hypothetical protein
MESFETAMDRIERGADKVDLGRKSAPRKAGRSRIPITDVEDVGGTESHKWSHEVVRRISNHGCPYV